MGSLKDWGPPLLKFGGTAFVIAFMTFGMLWNAMFAQMPRLPDKEALWALNRTPAIEFQDMHGDTIAVRGPRYGRAVRLDELPGHVVRAFIAAEDKRFLEHQGVDWTAIIRASLENVRAGRTVQGGSTITQQLVKNLFLSPDQTLKRKAQEARLAVELESKLTKNEVLELYLNRIYMGAGAYGLDAAAEIYFGKAPEDLTIAESAMLAAFPKAPSRFASTASTPDARARQYYVLDRMAEDNIITTAQADSAKRQTLEFAADRSDTFSGHALDYATEQVRQLLPDPPPDIVVRLTLDLTVQSAAGDAVREGVAQFGEQKRASEAAAILLDRNGAIRAMVGGTDYQKSQFNRAVQARRQPGSAFKMFVYAAALEYGAQPGQRGYYRPNSIRYDEPVRIGNWRPRNYGGEYRGAVTLSEALADSLNTVSAQLGVEIGIERVTELAQRFGIRTRLSNYPSVTLGSDEVTLLDITAGYGVLATEGKQVSPYIVEQISNSRGDVLYRRPEAEQAQIYQQSLAHDMTGMLSRVVVQGTGRGARIAGWEVAGKTGTSQEWRDAWFVGYTSRYIGGVWVGNDNDSPMVKVTGGEMPAGIWARFMTVAHNGIEPEPLAGAQDVEDFLSDGDQHRLAFYRRLGAAFSSVAERGGM